MPPLQQDGYLWGPCYHCQAAETQPQTVKMQALGKTAAAGFEVAFGAAEHWVVFVVVTETVWKFASGAAVSVGAVGTADRSSTVGEETDGGVNFAESVALEPCGLVVQVL